MDVGIGFWVGFNVFVLVMLALDLGVFHRHAHAVSIKEAGAWSVMWISLSLIFNLLLYTFWGQISPGSLYTPGEAGLAFLTGYLIEKALSVDNIFVFVMVFSYFAVPAAYQHRVLFWGILGALVMRGGMIAAGAALIHQFHWVIWVFGGFLILTGVRMAFHNSAAKIHPERNLLVRILKRLIPVTADYDGQRFFVRRDGVLMATPLLVVLLVVESTDVIFAVDSIPAIFAVTEDTFIVYTSNVFAILGLRSLYFVLAGAVTRFRYLQIGLSVILGFVGFKMLLPDLSRVLLGTSLKIPIPYSLMVVALILTTAIVASILRTESGGRSDADSTGGPHR